MGRRINLVKISAARPADNPSKSGLPALGLFHFQFLPGERENEVLKLMDVTN